MSGMTSRALIEYSDAKEQELQRLLDYAADDMAELVAKMDDLKWDHEKEIDKLQTQLDESQDENQQLRDKLADMEEEIEYLMKGDEE